MAIVEAPPYDPSKYIETLTGNKVSRTSVLCGSRNIRLFGKTIIHGGSIIRGDLANISIGKLSVVGKNTVIRPPYKGFRGGIALFPVTIGDHVFIEEDCVISAASIGSHVHVGKGCVIGKRCILRDCCYIAPGTVLPADTVVPPFSHFSGKPGVHVQELPDCFQDLQRRATVAYYSRFRQVSEAT